jgi:hypothetical protein
MRPACAPCKTPLLQGQLRCKQTKPYGFIAIFAQLVRGLFAAVLFD